MIHDPKTKSEISQDWCVVRTLCGSSHRQYVSWSGSVINESRPEEAFNLPLVLAYAVLDQVLSELCDQGAFTCKKWQLKEKMTASKNVLPWQDYKSVDSGRCARNVLAHEAKLQNKSDCLRYVDAIEAELRAWAII
jgi:hypothetical protein